MLNHCGVSRISLPQVGFVAVLCLFGSPLRARAAPADDPAARVTPVAPPASGATPAPPSPVPPVPVPEVAVVVAPPALPPVHFVAMDAPSLPEFKVKEADIDVIAMQTAIQTAVHPDDTPLQKGIRAAVIDFSVVRRPEDEPAWKDGLNPMVWVARTRTGTANWWREMQKIDSRTRPYFEGLPFLWQSDAPKWKEVETTKPMPAATAALGLDRSLSLRLNKQGLALLLDSGDMNGAADLLSRAVTADRSYAIPAYNSGILEMARHNRKGAITMLIRATDHTSDPTLKERENLFIKLTASLDSLLKKQEGSGRRLYDESIDTAWALANAEQYALAEYVAGQGIVLDPDERRSEAPLILAMCASKQNQKDRAVHWLSEAFARYQKNDGAHAELLALLKAAR